MISKIVPKGVLPLLVLVLCLLPVECNPPDDQDVTLLSQERDGITLEVVTPPWELESVSGPDGEYQRVRLPGWARTGQPGHPELPVRAVLVQVPETGEVKVEVLEEEYDSLSGCRIYPVPEHVLLEGDIPETRFVKNGMAYRSESFYPGTLFEAGVRSVIRGIHVVRVMVHPFRWNPSTGELLAAKRVRLRVRFETPDADGEDSRPSSIPAGPPQGLGDAFHALLQASVINYRGVQAPAAGFPRKPPDVAGKALLEASGLKIQLTEAGLYRLLHEDLIAAGVEVDDPQAVRLFNGGNEVAIRVSSPSAFEPGDYVEFFGEASVSPYSEINVYRLRQEPGTQGKRMSQADAGLTGTGTPVDGFTETLREEENQVMWGNTPGVPASDYWFRKKSTAPDLTEFDLYIPGPVPDLEEAVVRVSMQGRTTAAPHPNHHTVARLNGVEIGDATWDGDTVFVQEMTVPGNLVLEGANTLVVDLPGDTGAPVDVIYHNWVEVAYRRRCTALDDHLTFSLEGGERLLVEVDGLSGPDILLYDITDPLDVVEMVNIDVEPRGEGYAALFEVEPEETRTYTVLTAGQALQPASMEFREPAALLDPGNGADYLLITAGEFVGATAPLIALRESSGLRSLAVSVEDIYDVFNQGLTDPDAIRAFLQHTYENWTPPAPVYVLLVGDATVDYRGYLGTGKESRVPASLFVTPLLGLTPEDNRYVCLEGDDPLPEMFVGRIPGGSVQAVEDAVSKLLAYENSPEPSPPDLLFSADDNEAAFEQLNEDLMEYLSPEFPVHRVYLSQYTTVEDATQDLLLNLDQGRMITTYVGHGAVTNWAGEFMFQSSDVELLAAGGPPTFVIALECLNGYFMDTAEYCLAEAFLVPPDKGAIGVFAPAGLSYLWEHELLGHALFSRFFQQGVYTQGPWTIEAKLTAYAQGASEATFRSYTLMGDPALSLKVTAPPAWAASGR